ncbi:MAG: hypothetical protein QF530_07170 [SAR202 cluster bacterium]|jgi:hypothetical protein|nr:hypothetical protein [SAR202 cluster bacterium]|tara:strand:- start:54 stop:416 length:363 start_codon:yes stop_codon:yes gene_type:complete
MNKVLVFLIVGAFFLTACGGDSNSAAAPNPSNIPTPGKMMSWDTKMEASEAIAIVKAYIKDNCEPDSHYIENPDFFNAETSMGGWTVYYRHSPAQGVHSTGEWQVREATKSVKAIWDEDC